MKVSVGRICGLLVVLGLLAVVGTGAWAQEQDSPIIPDPNILKRTPIVDGVVAVGEWDLFQTFGIDDCQVSAYANWDDQNLYIAATSTQPCDVMVLLDANDDGWYHGVDNFEFRALRQEDGSFAKQVARYESRNTTSTIPTPVAENELEQVQLRTSATGGITHFEWKIPVALIRNFKVGQDKKIGLQIAARTGAEESSWMPTSVSAQTRGCVNSVLVTSKSTALFPMTLDFFMRDARIVHGDTLNAVVQLKNPGPDPIDVRAINISGNGMSHSFLDIIQKRAEGLEPKAKIKEEMKCLVPSTMALGTWVVGVEVLSDDGKIGAGLASFDIIEAFDVELKIPLADVPANSKEVVFEAKIRNNTRKSLVGQVKIELPIGWTLRKEINSRNYAIRTSRGETTIGFKAAPPVDYIGEVPVKMDITGLNQTKTVEGVFNLVNP